MNKKQAKSFLKGLGLKAEQIDKLVKHIPDDAEESTIEDIDAAHDSIRDHQIELFQSGETYKAALKTAADRKLAEAMSTAEKKVKKIAGLSEDETKDKKFDEIVDLAWKKAASNSNKSVEEVQAELRKVSDELKKVREVEIPEIESRVESEKSKFKIDNALTKTIGGLKLRQGVDLEDAMILVQQKAARKGYKVSIDDKNNLSFTDSEGNKVKSSDQKNFLTSNDILTDLLEGQIEKSGAPADPLKKDVKIDKTEKQEPINQGGTTVRENVNHAKEFLDKKRAEQGK